MTRNPTRRPAAILFALAALAALVLSICAASAVDAAQKGAPALGGPERAPAEPGQTSNDLDEAPYAKARTEPARPVVCDGRFSGRCL